MGEAETQKVNQEVELETLFKSKLMPEVRRFFPTSLPKVRGLNEATGHMSWVGIFLLLLVVTLTEGLGRYGANGIL